MKSFLKAACSFLICLVVPAIVFAQHQTHPALPHSKHKTVVIAHRGNHINAPENTLASTREAINCGADYVEVDLRTTKDGHLVAMHDAKVDRTTNGTGKVADMTWQEIEGLQVFNRNKKTHRIPEFKEMLALCKGKINIYLDFKDADVVETWKQIKAAGMEHQIVVYLNKEEQYKKWKEIAPEMPLMTSLPKEITNKEQLTAFLAHTHIQVADNIADPELLKAAHELGLSVWLDVQSPTEGPASWNEALHKGVQGLQTDKPAELVSYIKSHS
ncbi:glycerophosphodiester phosphodiesterase family protein [Dyadobacter sp. CY261]|uniref:glycerophosphodiester phosphodiesterase family protein n=1 Tax=Dyadobacter sp. CY261 TaxID=2907203 RepID=UPI001F24617A|nr:glycerophosphodiester phosphodiesterase family protein [Dyadobacter sp. CY261]MCF0072591.1 glycerophosphodiester phosphodiesterase family protein [Dyadobacter sp. CY261]